MGRLQRLSLFRTPDLVTAWLLALTVPFMIVGVGVFGHIGLGMLPLFIEWGIAGRNLRQRRPAGAGALGAAAT